MVFGYPGNVLEKESDSLMLMKLNQVSTPLNLQRNQEMKTIHGKSTESLLPLVPYNQNCIASDVPYKKSPITVDVCVKLVPKPKTKF